MLITLMITLLLKGGDNYLGAMRARPGLVSLIKFSYWIDRNIIPLLILDS